MHIYMSTYVLHVTSHTAPPPPQTSDAPQTIDIALYGHTESSESGPHVHCTHTQATQRAIDKQIGQMGGGGLFEQ
jgi:hypothetical protein